MAENLPDLVPELVDSHNLIQAARSDLEAAIQKSRATQGVWYPTLTIGSNYGYEQENKPGQTKDTHLPAREADFTVRQLLWDFGSANASIRSADVSVEAARYALDSTVQSVLLKGINSYLNVRRSAEVLNYARQSEENIKKQAEIENALVQRGAGLSTDVLNAKQQLAGAQARRVAAEGTLAQSRNAFRALFQRDVTDVEQMEKPTLPLETLPPSLEDSVAIAQQENPDLRKAVTDVQVAREAANKAKADGFFPTLNLVGQSKLKADVDGTPGRQEDLVGKVELNYPFNLGFTSINTLRAANETANAADKRVGETRDQVEKNVRDSWSQLETARQRLEFLRNQADIAAEYLDLARRERQLGNRTLNDILKAETDLINANSDAASAETDVASFVYAVLNSLGRLSPRNVTGKP
jgi:TolC family type I secretion outer membrane protein